MKFSSVLNWTSCLYLPNTEITAVLGLRVFCFDFLMLEIKLYIGPLHVSVFMCGGKSNIWEPDLCFCFNHVGPRSELRAK